MTDWDARGALYRTVVKCPECGETTQEEGAPFKCQCDRDAEWESRKDVDTEDCE